LERSANSIQWIWKNDLPHITFIFCVLPMSKRNARHLVISATLHSTLTIYSFQEKFFNDNFQVKAPRTASSDLSS